MDALFLRQAWAGNEPCCSRSPPTRRRRARRGCTTSSSTRARGRGSTTTRRSSPGAPAKPAEANFYPADATKAEVETWMQALPPAERARGHRVLHHHPPRRRRQARRRALHRRVPGRARRCAARAAARGGGAHHAADAEGVPREARARVPLERLLRQRRGVDGAGRVASSRPSAPTRSTRTSWFNYKAAFEAFITVRDDAETKKLAQFSARAAGHREPPADRPEAAQPEARRAGADPRGQRDVLPPATPTTACRPPPSICRTTSASPRRRAPSA